MTIRPRPETHSFSYSIACVDSDDGVRLRFYGLEDYGTYFQIDQAFRLALDFDSSRTEFSLNDVVELHNVAMFIDNDLFPNSSLPSERSTATKRVPEMRRTVGTFFRGITETTFATRINDVDYQYHSDVLSLLASNKAFQRCSATVVLGGLASAGFSNYDLLSSRPLVQTYDQDVRALMLASPGSAEQVIKRNLQSASQDAIYLPTSLTAADIRGYSMHI